MCSIRPLGGTKWVSIPLWVGHMDKPLDGQILSHVCQLSHILVRLVFGGSCKIKSSHREHFK